MKSDRAGRCRFGSVGLFSDEVARVLHEYLLREASVPYFHMLDQWISLGVIRDPYGEFMVVFNPKLSQERRRDIIDPDAYWTERFRVNEHRQPVFLKPWARLICDTGKYINVLQEIGIAANANPEPKVRHLKDSSQAARARPCTVSVDVEGGNESWLP